MILKYLWRAENTNDPSNHATALITVIALVPNPTRYITCGFLALPAGKTDGLWL